MIFWKENIPTESAAKLRFLEGECQTGTVKIGIEFYFF